jgi:hypothetical protein
MEDKPYVVENDASNKDSRRLQENLKDQEGRKSGSKKPEALGILAVEAKPESQPAPEHIGHMLLASKAETDRRHQKPAPETTTPSIGEALTGKRIDTLSRAELMALAEKISIDESNLRHIYETHLIGERGLRRLVAEHLGGGDLRKALKREVMEREMDFERDPVMRDHVSVAAAPANISSAALEKLLQKAAVSVADSGEEAAFFKARSRYEAAHHQQHHYQRRFIDISLFSVIAILIILVIVMYLSRT